MLVSAPIIVNIRIIHESPSRNMNPASNASSLQLAFLFVFLGSTWFLFCWLILSLNNNVAWSNEDANIKDHDENNWTKKCSKEHTNITNEAAMRDNYNMNSTFIVLTHNPLVVLDSVM